MGKVMERRTEMQDLIMHHALSAFYALSDDGVDPDDPRWIELDRQIRRIEKLFGYEPGSWKRD